MSKLKAVLWIVVVIVLMVFAYENAQPSPMLKFFKYPLAELPTYILIYLSLVVGLVIGWFAHGLRIRRKRREAQAQAASAQQQQEAQEGQGGHQAE
jgi:uncharacterized integral membrane protein